MPTYKITDSQTGKTLRVTGDKPPSEQEMTEIFSQYQTKEPQKTPQVKQVNPAIQSVLNLISPSMRIGDIAKGVVSAENTGVPSQVRQFTAPRVEQVISKAKQGELPTAREAGSAVLEQGAYLLPFNKINLGNKDILQRLATAGAQGTAQGATVGASKAIAEAQTPGEAVQDVGVASLLGLGTGTAMQAGAEALAGTQKLFSKTADFFRKKGYEAFGNTFKQNATAQKIINQSGGPEKLAKEMIDNKIPKTKQGVQKELRNLSSKYESEVTNKLKTLGKTRSVDVDTLIDEAIAEGNKLYSLPTPNEQRELKAYTAYLESLRGQYTGPKANLNNVNELRKSLDKTYQGIDPSKVVDGEKAANDILANKLRSSIQEKAPLTKEFFKKYSLLKKADQIFFKEPKSGIVEIAGAGVLPGSGAVNVLEFLAGKALRSPGVARSASAMVAGQSPRMTIPTPNVSQAGLKTKTTNILPSISALQRAIENERKSKTKNQQLPSGF